MKKFKTYNKFLWKKEGFIVKPENINNWWKTHAMAPTPILLNESTIRIFVGGLDKNNISRVGYIDVNSDNPKEVKGLSSKPIIDIGIDGCFDDNGVFPGHAYKLSENEIFLYYTGFQLLDKIPFSNFSGLGFSIDGGNTFKKHSEAPILDRADEGLYTRAGLSTIFHEDKFKCCYSSGSSWQKIANKKRPVYEVRYIESKDGINFKNNGNLIVPVNLENEHGLGRPQIIELFNELFVFYTVRTLDFKYFIGCAINDKVNNKWVRIDNWLSSINHGIEGEFDSNMVYFPSVIDTGNKVFMFYSGNSFGKDGLGFAQLLGLDLNV